MNLQWTGNCDKKEINLVGFIESTLYGQIPFYPIIHLTIKSPFYPIIHLVLEYTHVISLGSHLGNFSQNFKIVTKMKKKKVFEDKRTPLELEQAYKDEASWFKAGDGVFACSKEMMAMCRSPYKVRVQSRLFYTFQDRNTGLLHD